MNMSKDRPEKKFVLRIEREKSGTRESPAEALSKRPCQWWHHKPCTTAPEASQPALKECTHTHI